VGAGQLSAAGALAREENGEDGLPLMSVESSGSAVSDTAKASLQILQGTFMVKSEQACPLADDFI
jgi:hypothetical protein